MVLVILSALFGAAIFLLFRVFDKRHIPLLPAIAVNYVIALVFGVLHSPPWMAGDISSLWLPSVGVGTLFIGVFFLTAVTTQLAGVAASTVASKLSLVITVLFAVFVYSESPGLLGWAGISCALIAVPLSTMGDRSKSGDRTLLLLLFLGTAAIDISLNAVQRMHLTPDNEGVFPSLCFIWAAVIAGLVLWYKKELNAFRDPRVWIAGAILGVINFLALLFVLRALAHSGMGASTVFPMLSIGVILIGTFGSIVIFNERPTKIQLIGIGVAMIAMILLVASNP